MPLSGRRPAEMHGHSSSSHDSSRKMTELGLGRQREERDTLTQLRKWNSRRRRTLRHEARGGHSRQRIHLETVELPLLRHAKIDPRTPAKLEADKRSLRLALHLRRLLSGEGGGKGLHRHSGGVFGLVVVDLLLRDDL